MDDDLGNCRGEEGRNKESFHAPQTDLPPTRRGLNLND